MYVVPCSVSMKRNNVIYHFVCCFSVYLKLCTDSFFFIIALIYVTIFLCLFAGVVVDKYPKVSLILV